MSYFLVAPLKTFSTKKDFLTYQSTLPLKKGQLVSVPFGRTHTLGLVIKKTIAPNFPTKSVLELLFTPALPNHLVSALFWLADYYHVPLASALSAALPAKLSPSLSPQSEDAVLNTAATNPLGDAQKIALKQIKQLFLDRRRTVLLHGITGSGKTNLYIALAREVFQKGQSVIVLVPEIALTSQLLANFKRHFQNILVFHSGLSEKKRRELWLTALFRQGPSLIIGPRSALFAPVKKLGLIIIDEAHEPSYHQAQNPKYSALRLASVLAPTLLGTATPLVQDFFLAKTHRSIVSLNQLALPQPKQNHIQLVDMRDRQAFRASQIFSQPLLEAITRSLEHQKQSLIFHNRRGTATLTLCEHCGWQSLCPYCFLPLTLHADAFTMRCHSCGRSFPVPTACPICHHTGIHHKGLGTKALTHELTRLFPSARIARFDSDATGKNSLLARYQDIINGKLDILVGTQMLAKGFDFPKLSTLGIVQADVGLSLPDFAAPERNFNTISQVLGRIQRGHQESYAFIQTYTPDHPLIVSALKHDYSAFYAYTIKIRQASFLPPFAFLLRLSLTYKTEDTTVKNIRLLRDNILASPLQDKLQVTPVMPAFHERSPRGYTWHILVKAKQRRHLLDLLSLLPKNPRLRFELDPPSLL